MVARSPLADGEKWGLGKISDLFKVTKEARACPGAACRILSSGVILTREGGPFSGREGGEDKR